MLQLFHIPFKNWMQSDFHFHEIALQKHETKVGLSKHIRWPDQNWSETGRPDLLRRSTVDFIHQKSTPAGWFQFLSPKNPKNPNWPAENP